MPILRKKAKGVADASSSNANTTTSTSTSTEPTLTDFDNGLPDEELKRKAKPHKGKEKVVIDLTQDDDDIQYNYIHQRWNDRRLRLFPGDPIICQLIQAADLFKKLSLKDNLSLALTSTRIFKQLSPLISNTYLFNYHDHTNIQHYHPRKLFVMTDNLKALITKSHFSNLREIEFHVECNFPVPPLPESVTHLTLGHKFNEKIKNLPSKLTHLTFQYGFNRPISRDNLPPRLTYLSLSKKFEQPITTLPNTLTVIQFGERFNEPVSTHNLPACLTKITFGKCFNHPIDGLLPAKLTHLSFNIFSEFDQTINDLPPRLTHLLFNNFSLFDQPISHLPRTITHLELGMSFNQPLVNLPPGLIHVEFSANFDFNQYYHGLPPKVTTLCFGIYFSQRLNSLPTNIREVTFYNGYNQPIDHLSKNIVFKIIMVVNNAMSTVIVPYQYQPIQ
eukprot:TRINITY_DN7219_c0_g2_i1.p1 TRINITY_DN7219_c0_g2~~TRINITY_DN7219_c0_g2_i1.p1  ORF type:complete len:446 (+),score=59.91 TRINITY_DN7219_c0_g2_i1:150-1487(+)